MKRFQTLFAVRSNLRNLNKEAAFDSMRNVLAVLGFGLLIGDFATMRLPYVIPGIALLLAVWYADYLRHDLPSSMTAIAVSELEKKQGSADPIDQLSRVS